MLSLDVYTFCSTVTNMKGTELGRQLKALGWFPISDVNSRGTRMWSNGEQMMPVPADELILDSVAAAILNVARGGTV